MDKSAWVGKSTRVEKPWGYEIVFSGIQTLQGKEVHIFKDKRTSLKYHTNKDEVLYLVSGRAKVEYAPEAWQYYSNVAIETSILEPGQYLAVQSSCLYRITAEEDCVFLEISSRSSGETIRVEDDYGRPTRSPKSKIS